MRVKQKFGQILVVVILVSQLLTPAAAWAQQSASTHYQVNEVQFGSGGNNGSSAHFNGQSSLGSLGGGQASSANFTANAGFLTQNEPYLEIGVISGTVNLGDLTASSTSSGAGSFYVRAYTAGGYSIATLSSPPSTVGGQTLTAKSTLGIPVIGTEEFGMNLVKNPNFCGSGCDLGADPVPVPNSSFASGAAASGYSTAGQFKYAAGDVIATAPSGNGQTNFTVSFIADINGATAAGTYAMKADFVVVAFY